MLKRRFLQSDPFKDVLASLLEHIRWSPERIANSLRDTLPDRSVYGDVWLFCYVDEDSQGMGTANRLRARLGQTEMVDLALGNQIFHCTGNVFDRHCGIDTVLVEQVDGVDA